MSTEGNTLGLNNNTKVIRKDYVVLEESFPLNTLGKILGSQLEIKESFFNPKAEYGICNMLLPLLNVHRYLVAVEVKLLGKTPDLIALARDFLIGKRIFYGSIFPPIMIIEAKSNRLSERDLKQLRDYVSLFHHVFLLTNDYVFRNILGMYKKGGVEKDIFEMFREGTLSFIIANPTVQNVIRVVYIINVRSHSNVIRCSKEISEVIREELAEFIADKKNNVELSKLRKKFYDVFNLAYVSGYFISPAHALEDALRRSRLALLFRNYRLKEIYRKGLGHLLALFTSASTFLLLESPEKFKLPRMYMLWDRLTEFTFDYDKTIDEIARGL